METLETIKLDLMQRLERYRHQPDAHPYAIARMEEKLAVLNRCVDLNDSGVDNQLLIAARNAIWKGMHVARPSDVLIFGLRLTDSPVIQNIGLVDMTYTSKIAGPQEGLYDLLDIVQCDRRAVAEGRIGDAPSAKYHFDWVMEHVDWYKI